MSEEPKPDPPAKAPTFAERVGAQFEAMKLKKISTDPAYGYSEEKPIPVGGGLGGGSRQVYRYLNGLAGPKGEKIRYSRIGSCCPFETDEAMLGGGLLEIFEVWYEGAEPRHLYFNWYERDDVLVPTGLAPRGQ